MFSSTKLFQAIPCPLGEDCRVRHCLFAHELLKSCVPPAKHEVDLRAQEGHGGASRKRHLPANDNRTKANEHKPSRNFATAQDAIKTASSPRPVTTLMRPVSPPSLKSPRPNESTFVSKIPRVSTPVAKQTLKAEALIPRTMAQPPVQYPVRLQLLKLIHEQFVRLNKELAASSDPEREALKMTSQELIAEALNEEEKTAKENPKVYSNVLKLRIVALRKMVLKDWKKIRLEQIARMQPEEAKPARKAQKRFDSGLSAEEELALLPRLVTPIEELAEYGYVAKPLSERAVKEAEAGVNAAAGWEHCDRCESRFQVFPGRREDGILTTNGPCVYHWGRKRRPARRPGESGPRDDLWTCCRGEMGSKGCTKVDSHVFKVSDPKRLAYIMQFEETKRTPGALPKEAVAFDCEMGYTSFGMEMIRLTATAWPSGKELVDVLVRPLGEILDLNSRFSGVWPDDMANAIPYMSSATETGDEGTSRKRRKIDSGEAASVQLRIVDSPAKARELLQEHLTIETPLIGHAIDNDLNVVRICHPMIVDTVLLFPHPQGLPYRYGLKMLSKTHLDIDIQTGGDAGHDSKEDARATGELVRFKAAQVWKDMKRQGWKLDNGVFNPPEHRSHAVV